MRGSPRTTRRTRAALAAAAALLAVAGGAGVARAQRASARAASATDGVIAVRATVRGTDIVREARRFLGVPYRLGGTTPRAFDCSGFVRYVFAHYGIELPRTAHEQAGVGVAPPPGDLRPGDLLFFYGGHGAQHIAIYVGGDTIIHASSSGHRVKLDRLTGRGHRRTWFRERLIAVRRIAPIEGVFQIPSAPATQPGAAVAELLPKNVLAGPLVY